MPSEWHPLDPGTERRQLTVALPQDQWRVLEGMMKAMEELDPGGAPHRYGYLVTAGLLRLRSLTRKSGSALTAWRMFLEGLAREAESDEAASGAVWDNPRTAWPRFWRIAWGMWWRYQIVNVCTGLLVYYAPGPPVIQVVFVGVWVAINVFGLGLAVSRAFNAYRQRYGSLPVLLGRPYG
jgi:hypothetical protein